MIEHEEVFFSEEESLQLIAKMISKAKNDFVETGISALMWGTIVTLCALVQFASAFYTIPWADNIWFLTFFAVIPQLVISYRERKRKKFSTYHDDAMGGIWISFGITMFLLSFYFATLNVAYNAIASRYIVPDNLWHSHFRYGLFAPFHADGDWWCGLLAVCHSERLYRISLHDAADSWRCFAGMVYSRYDIATTVLESKEATACLKTSIPYCIRSSGWPL